MSEIRMVKPDKVLVHFINWPSQWDEWLPVDSDRFAAKHTHCAEPHQPKSEP